ncbi:MAG: hypothetical protein KKC77_12870 [Proteobacteria bacterium]|nr:hypothetical protein [Pseudomonadota bacterium]MBU1233775.1 hypothetical protein [Pseudomonadota bacterium]
MTKQSVSNTVTSLGDLRYWYQRIEVDGEVTPVFNKGMAESPFYNQGKWEHFIKPLIPFAPEGRSFVECGCNAGLFLLLAAEMGFSQVLGLEGDDAWYKQACFILNHYQAREPELYRSVSLAHTRIGKAGEGASKSCTIESSCLRKEWSSLPSADLTLLANVLYWIDRESAARYITELAHASEYCIVVSVNGSYPLGGPCSREEICHAFKNDWEEVQGISPPPLNTGERGRDMFSILFRSRFVSSHHIKKVSAQRTEL